MPIQRPPVSDDDAPPLTQYEMFALADLGLLKMDFLGLSNLTIIDPNYQNDSEKNWRSYRLGYNSKR